MDFDSAVNNFNQALLGSAQMIAASNTSHEDRRLVREQNDISRQWNEKVWHMQKGADKSTDLVSQRSRQ